MKLLRQEVSNTEPFENNTLNLDFFAEDQVRDYGPGSSVFRIGDDSSSIYSQNVVCIAGINASGKTRALMSTSFVVDVLTGDTLHWMPATDPAISHIQAIFTANNKYYLLDANLAAQNTTNGGEQYAFSHETVWQYKKKIPSKSQLKDFSVFKANAHIIKVRIPLSQKQHAAEYSGLPDSCFLSDESAEYLSPFTSIVRPLTMSHRAGLLAQLQIHHIDQSNIFFSATEDCQLQSTIAGPILQAFDDSIEYCTVDQQNIVHLKFADAQKEKKVSLEEAASILSSGTQRGAQMISKAIYVLKTGGYFFVDEIENSINKELVHMILSLFVSRSTNPRGATLVFSTHYPELLDFIKRKDNIYFFRRIKDANHRVQTTKYSDIVKRGELKRSEVFLSNYALGTSPKASEIKAMRRYIAQQVAAEGTHGR
ncbi:hypothetical protein KIM372_00780 [Bombiscardovia nodaiensis]|uniref:ATPase AAA-type core domain-containing protein n=1 Tax=Bombiscardovia nodaiensis TaxID=2932181 RepID=A0ABM8B629_9BIFI|nr:hypothetical protein KIM372_00780 [Bombiscardovia nodaiensis]